MRMHDILREDDGSTLALSLIDKAAKRFGRDRLSGGNCGTFALALAMALQEQGLAPTLAFSYREKGRCDTIEEVIEAETDIYHVVVMLGERMFDATGETNADALLRLARMEYGDRRPSFFRDIAVDDFAMHQLISTETNWSINTGTFRAAFVAKERKPSLPR